MNFRYFFIFPLLGLVALQVTDAKKLYKYQDAQGRWHYTDKAPPKDITTVETKQLRISRRAEKVSVVRRGLKTEPSFHIINEYRGPIELELMLADSDNILVAPDLPKRFVVAGASEVRAAVIRPAAKDKAWSYDVRYRLMLGDPKANHQPARPYRLPFASGRFAISQGFHGQFSHNEPASAYAIDIGMPVGTEIVAARDGIVMDVANDFFSGGGNKNKYLDRANMIRILHDDGTMAVYGHLRLESAYVSPGMRVVAGQVIGQSGNTGFSTGPHLHFVIQKNAGMKLVSLPFQFANEQGIGFTPEEGMILKAHVNHD